MGELLETAKALSAPATKLVEVVSRGIGRAYDPRYKRKMADAAAYEIDTIAGAIRRNGDVPTFFDREGIQLDARSAQELAERTQMRLFSQEMRKQQNIEAIVDKAYEELKDEKTVTNEPVDDDWIIRFFNCVEDISSEEMREIWASVLAGEIKNPKSFSLRTLETLKNISQKEAIIFNKVAALSVKLNERRLLVSDMSILREYDVKLDDIRLLDECGLLVCDFSSTIVTKIGYHDVLIMGTDSLLVQVANEAYFGGDFELRCIQFTSAGRELANSLNITTNQEGIMRLLSSVHEKNYTYKFSAYTVQNDSSGKPYVNMNIDLFLNY